MVIKNVKTPNEEYISRKAVSKKEIPVEIRYPHRRECSELKESINCKKVIKKKVSEEQAITYDQIFQADRQRVKNREYRRNRQVGKTK